MKKYLLLLVMLLIAIASRATISFSMNEVKAKPGQTFTLPVIVTNDEEFAGFELRIYLPEGISFQGTTRAKRVQAGERLDGFTISGSNQTDGSYKILAANLDGEMIAIGDDALFNLLLKAENNVALGNATVKLGIIRYTDTQETLHNLDDVQGNIKVYQEYTVAVTTADETMGTVTGGGTFESGTSATLTATPTEGYHFVKWSDEATDNPYTFTVNADVNLTASFAPNQYTITFDSNGGSAVADITADYKSAITAPADPTREGYDFAGWNPAFPETMPLNGAALTAQWTAINYSLTYDLAGGAVATANPESYTIESDAITLTNPTREGYTFAGWTGTGLTEATQAVTIAKGSIGNRSYTATWTPIVYTLSYELAGGAVATANPESYTIESDAITLTNPTRDGYDFAGWTGTDLTEATATVTITKGSTGNRSYTATWTPIVYTLSYELAGGAVATANPESYTIESDAITLTNPTREGYTFAGWTGTGLTEATQAVTIAKGSIGNRSYTATWTPIVYTLSYELAGGAVATANPETYTIESEAITLTNPTRDGYTFAGWTGTGLTEATATVTIAKGSTGNRSYTATWTPIVYTLSYELAGGAVATANPESYTIESDAITLTNPTRDGYDFAGWTGTDLTEATATVTITKGSTGNRSYTATWTPIVYTLSYELAGGELATANPENYTIESETITLNNPTKTGYTFAGWTGTDLTEATATVTIAKGSTGNRSYTATWTPVGYTISYNLDGGVLAEGVTNPTTYNIESETITLNNPTKTGYTFAGWTGTDLTEATQTVTIAKGSMGDRSYTATWNINQYTMTFVFGGNGQENVEITKDYGTALTAPEVNAWEGHTFTAWDPAVPETIPAENKTFTAQWSVNKYKLTFMVDEEVYQQTEVEYGATIAAPATNPTKTGYTFTAWDADIPETMPANDLTFNAQFTINQYTMTFVFGGNGQENVEITQDYGTALTAPEVNAWEGHTFTAWDPVVPETIPAENKTFTAQWDVNKYTLTFMVDETIYKQEEVEYGAAITAPEDPEKEGHTFTAWDADIPETMPANDLTFNAQFSVNKYNVIYIVKEQEWARDEVAFGEPIVLREYTPEAGEVFNGWLCDEEYTTMPAHDVTYTADIQIPQGIIRVFLDKEKVDVYTATGILVDRQLSVYDVLKLPKGVYIINNQKIVIK